MFWIYPSLAMLLGGPDPVGSPGSTEPVVPIELGSPAGPIAPAAAERVTLGLEVLLTDRIDLIKGKKVGLLTHPAAVDAEWVPSIDRMVRAGKGAGGFRIVQLYGPEHGIRGFMSAGEKTGAGQDPHTGLPVENLFGLGRRGRPSAASLKRIDVLVVDLQDLGSRTYTYVSTLGEAMEAAGEAGKKVIVLDRPNPYGGLVFEGPVLRKGHRSFIGWASLPVTHGMTIGEVARYYQAYEGVTCDLEVITMRGWKRSMSWRETGLPWTPTSPGIPHVENAWLYAATGMVGGISDNVSEGVGTTLPFEQVGAEWIEAPKLAAELLAKALPGLQIRATTFRPNWFNFKGKVLHGVQLVVTDPLAFRPIRTALSLLTAIEKLYPGQATFRDNHDNVWGTDRVLELVRAGRSAEKIEATWKKDLDAYAERRAKVLLYD